MLTSAYLEMTKGELPPSWLVLAQSVHACVSTAHGGLMAPLKSARQVCEMCECMLAYALRAPLGMGLLGCFPVHSQPSSQVLHPAKGCRGVKILLIIVYVNQYGVTS